MTINENPTGYLVMDTCSFLNYCREDDNINFNYKAIKEYVNNEGLWVVITPYTLYECIQDCFTPQQIKARREDLFRAGDFWVVNVNRIIGNEYTFEYGLDFWLEFKFDPNKPQEFIKKRDEWREKVYDTLAPRIILLAQIISIIYVLLLETNKDGSILKSTQLKIKHIDEYFGSHPNFRAELNLLFVRPDGLGYKQGDDGYENAIDAKDYLKPFVDDMIIQILAVTNVQIDEVLSRKKVSFGEFNARIANEYYRIKDLYPQELMARKYKEINKETHGKFSINALLDSFLIQKAPIFKHLFKRVVNNWFQPQYGGKELMNTIIDYINMGMVEADRNKPLIYMTEEKGLNDYILSLNDESVRSTKEFYNRFYKRIK